LGSSPLGLPHDHPRQGHRLSLHPLLQSLLDLCRLSRSGQGLESSHGLPPGSRSCAKDEGRNVSDLLHLHGFRRRRCLRPHHLVFHVCRHLQGGQLHGQSRHDHLQACKHELLLSRRPFWMEALTLLRERRRSR